MGGGHLDHDQMGQFFSLLPHWIWGSQESLPDLVLGSGDDLEESQIGEDRKLLAEVKWSAPHLQAGRQAGRNV